MKSEILKLLREADNYVSGQELCDRFQVSRTAVWKVINQLKEDGYSIEAVRNKGYHIIDSPDIMNKEEIESHVRSKEMGCHVVSLDVTDSTNKQAKVLAEEGCQHGTLVAADQQVQGKGRRGRVWESPKGTTISMSLVLRPTFAPNKAPMLTLIMALSVARAIQMYGEGAKNLGVRDLDMKSLDVQIKWPNDIVVNGRKVCGILTEMSTEIDYINYVVIGTGINVNVESFPEELDGVATSLKLECKSADSLEGVTIARAKLMGLILEAFEIYYETFCKVEDLSFLREEYNQLLANAGKQVRVLEPGNAYEAYAIGINDLGELQVRLDSGEVRNVYAGEVSVRGIYGYV